MRDQGTKSRVLHMGNCAGVRCEWHVATYRGHAGSVVGIALSITVLQVDLNAGACKLECLPASFPPEWLGPPSSILVENGQGG